MALTYGTNHIVGLPLRQPMRGFGQQQDDRPLRTPRR
jgi:hypothetical protein